MLARCLVPLALLLCLAFAPGASAETTGEPTGDQPSGCVQPGDADADNVSEEDLCQTDGGAGGGGQSCEPTPEPGTTGGGTEPGGDQTADAGDASADPAGDGDTGGDAAEDPAIDLPFEAQREYRDFCEMPEFDRGFLRRTWRFGGDATSFGDGILTMTVTSPPRVPARFREQASRFLGLEVAVVLGRRTDVVSARRARRSSRGGRRGGRGGNRRVSPRALSRAGRVQVQGKLLPPSRWRQDANGQRIPTIRASRVTIGG